MLMGGVSILLIVLTIQWWRNPTIVPDPQPPAGPRAAELADRIDPNTADWPALAVLPMIGEKRARDIVAYRTQYTATHPGRAFTHPVDLTNVPGIGPAIVETITPYLMFNPPATQPIQ